MRELLEVVALILLVSFGLALFFLFAGEPSLWAKLHAAAMRAVP